MSSRSDRPVTVIRENLRRAASVAGVVSRRVGGQTGVPECLEAAFLPKELAMSSNAMHEICKLR